MGVQTFQVADYSIFAVVIAVSLGIGVFHALTGGKQRTMSEYLVGGRTMTFLPVAISLLASFESSIMMLGIPAEGYVYGIQYLIIISGLLFTELLSVYLMVPLVHPLRLTSAYEYLELRFKSRLVRKLGSILGILGNVWYMGIVLFGPATALEAVAGFPQWASIFLIALAAIIYTSIGTMDVGGPSEVWRRANEGGRNNLFNFDPDPTVRHTFWNLLFAYSMRGITIVFSQSTIQRISATRSLKDAMIAVYLMCFGYVVTLVMAIMEGVVAYSYYDSRGCDPFESKQIANVNQIVPFLVMDMYRSLPGVPGLFLAALFSASLSTISSCLSSLSAITWKDFVQPVFPNMSEFRALLIAKLSVIVYGMLACGVSVLVSLVGGPLPQITGTFLSSFSGPLAGIFIVGSLTSIANAKGAMAGAIVSFILTAWISMGSSLSLHRKKTPWLPPASMDNCPSGLNTSTFHNTSYFTYDTTSSYPTTPSTGGDANQGPHGIEKVYLMSYTLYTTVAIVVTVMVCLPVSYITAKEEDKPDPRYVVPVWGKLCTCLPVSITKRWCGHSEVHAKEVSLPDNILDTEIRVLNINPINSELPLRPVNGNVERLPVADSIAKHPSHVASDEWKDGEKTTRVGNESINDGYLDDDNAASIHDDKRL